MAARPLPLVVALVLVVGCSSNLREVRAREPEGRFAGVPRARQVETARCIRDGLDERVDGFRLLRAQADDRLRDVEQLLEALQGDRDRGART